MKAWSENVLRWKRNVLQGSVWICYFIGASILISLVFPAMVLLLPRKTRALRIRRVVAFGFRTMTWWAQTLGSLGKVHIEGRENLPTQGCYLVAANHPSFYDVILLIGILRGANCVVNRKLLEQPFYGFIIRFAGYIPNDLEGYREGVRRYRGEGALPLIVFPEGTRTVTEGTVNPFQRGCARLAIENELPVIPVLLSYSEKLLKKGTPWYKAPPRAPSIRIRFLPAIAPADGAENPEMPITLRVRRYNDQMQNFFTHQLRVAQSGATHCETTTNA